MNPKKFGRSELKKLSFLIGTKPADIESVSKDLAAYYYTWSETKTDPSTGLPRRYLDGTPKTRTLCPSFGKLKLLQARIKSKILDEIELLSCVHGSVRKRSNLTNAKTHQGNKYLFTTDLRDFYPSINSKQVYNALVSCGLSVHFAHWITKLTTWKNQLPQGTPTSPSLANLVFIETDKVLSRMAAEYGLTYTRYVDDLTFSSPQDFSEEIGFLLTSIESAGFQINYRKTHYKQNQTVTGIKVLLHKLDAPDFIKEMAAFEDANDLDQRPYSNYLKSIKVTRKPPPKKSSVS